MTNTQRRPQGRQPAVICLGLQAIHVGMFRADRSIEVHHIPWNSSPLDLENPSGLQQLTAALQTAARQCGLHRHPIRLCVDNTLCVTRVATGPSETVEKELDAIRSRSQLYLSLGLGEKLTGTVLEKQEGQGLYALSAIANLRAMQSIQTAFQAAHLRLESIEPATSSVVRGVGYLGLDRDQPVILLSVDSNRCDLAISRDGRPMLSYRMSGVRSAADIADQLGSHLTRLRRFCQRVRAQEDRPLETIYVYGNPGDVQSVSSALRSAQVDLFIEELPVPDDLEIDNPDGVPNSVILGLWAGGLWSTGDHRFLMPPDWLEQLSRMQQVPVGWRLMRRLIPSMVAAGLILAVQVLHWHDARRLSSKKREVEATTSELASAELELFEWQAKEELIQNYRSLESELSSTRWDHFIEKLAPCMPNNTRLESFAAADDFVITLRGSMVGTDNTYEMLSAIKQLPGISEVSLEAVNAVGDAKQSQMQFEVKCRTKEPKAVSKGHLVRQRSHSPIDSNGLPFHEAR